MPLRTDPTYGEEPPTEWTTVQISRVHIKNFRNFLDFTIDPFPQQAVVVGENNSGKSNLLYALRLVLDPSLPDTSRMLRMEDIPESKQGVVAAGIEVRISVDISGFDFDDAARGELDGFIIATDPLTARLTYVFRPTGFDPLDGSQDRTQSPEDEQYELDDYEVLFFGGDDEAREARRLRRAINITVLPPLRDAAHELSSTRRSPLTELTQHLPTNSEAVATAVSDINAATDKLSRDEKIRELAQTIEQRIKAMSGPQLAIRPALGIAPSDSSKLVRSLRLFVDTERRYTVSDTSTGSANVIYMALLLERLLLRQRSGRVVDTLLAVEEPEAHLHPTIQRHLFGDFLQRNINIVLTTHSSNIAAVSPLASLVLLSRQADGPTEPRTVVGAELTDEQAADIERYLDVTRAEVLFSRFVILVEGIAEQYLLPAIGHALDFDLDAYGAVITSVAGVDFKPYTRFLGENGLGIPYVVLTDGDRWKRKGWLGLLRSAQLVPEAHMEMVKVQVATLREGADTTLANSTATFLDNHKVHVGWDTMEIDLAVGFRDEMIHAYNDLQGGRELRGYFAEHLPEQIPDTVDAHELATGAIDLIERIGKGRYAQRLAGRIREARRDRVIENLKRIRQQAGKDFAPLRALDSASKCLRGGETLLPPQEPDSPEGIA